MASAWIALLLAFALAAAATFATGLPPAGLALGLILASLAVSGLARLARRLIGGQTGDIVGAAQQLAEIAIYCGFAFVVGSR
jgi:adenosylcobinamide-GDP ribazoletransferase